MRLAFVGVDRLVVRLLDRLIGSDLDILGVAGNVPADATIRWPELDVFNDATELLLERTPDVLLVAEGSVRDLQVAAGLECLVLAIGEGGPLAAFLTAVLDSEGEEQERARRVSRFLTERQFQERLAEEMRRASRYSVNLSLGIFVLEGFRSFQERNGNELAELALQDFCDIVSRNVRDVDILGRLGGGRLAVLLPETGRLGALKLADRIRCVVEGYPFPSAELRRVERLRANGGISSFPAVADTADELYEQALEALDASLRVGPNQTRLFKKPA
ncbi:MAG: GGDEF domain-containing protein [Candidatus Geothermincolia bacterium]